VTKDGDKTGKNVEGIRIGGPFPRFKGNRFAAGRKEGGGGGGGGFRGRWLLGGLGPGAGGGWAEGGALGGWMVVGKFVRKTIGWSGPDRGARPEKGDRGRCRGSLTIHPTSTPPLTLFPPF